MFISTGRIGVGLDDEDYVYCGGFGGQSWGYHILINKFLWNIEERCDMGRDFRDMHVLCECWRLRSRCGGLEDDEYGRDERTL